MRKAEWSYLKDFLYIKLLTLLGAILMGNLNNTFRQKRFHDMNPIFNMQCWKRTSFHAYFHPPRRLNISGEMRK